MAFRPLPCVLTCCAALAVPATPALAAPPANDSPAGAASFESYTAENGAPAARQAVAELVEATPDGGVPSCLGAGSFARTVWYRVPATPGPQELTVEATGRTLDVVDLAAFVQPPAPPAPPPPADGSPPPPPPQPPVLTSEPNACGGLGAGGADASEEPASAVSLRVPGGRSVLVQVGRRGSVGSAADERALLSLEAEEFVNLGTPPGDRAGATTPRASNTRSTRVELTDATTTEEDPAQPSCPSLGSVWRRLVPNRTGRRIVSVAGARAGTLTVFSGRRPTADNVLDCVNRQASGPLQMLVAAKRRKPLWIRIGTDVTPDFADARLTARPARGAVVVDGGPGGFDPTPGGPAGGLPESCAQSLAEAARVSGRSFGGRAPAYNQRRTVPLSVRARGATLCDVQFTLRGPRGRTYARGRAIRLGATRTVRLQRVARFVRGAYRLRVSAVSRSGPRVRVRTRLTGRLR